MEENKKRKEIELESDWAVIELPQNAVGVKLIVKIIDDKTSNIGEVERVMTFADVKEAFKKADGYIDDDDVFVLTEKGRAYLDELKQNGRITD